MANPTYSLDVVNIPNYGFENSDDEILSSQNQHYPASSSSRALLLLADLAICRAREKSHSIIRKVKISS